MDSKEGGAKVGKPGKLSARKVRRDFLKGFQHRPEALSISQKSSAKHQPFGKGKLTQQARAHTDKRTALLYARTRQHVEHGQATMPTIRLLR